MGRRWGGFKDEAAHEEDGAVGLAEPDQDEGLEHVDFAAITGKAAPGSSPGSASIASLREAAVAAEPAKKKKRKREANPFLRIVGIVVCGLLAVPCALLIAHYAGAKLDFLPSWVPLISHKPSTHADAPKPGGESNTTANGQTPANATPTGPDAGKTVQPPVTDNSQPKTGNASPDNQSATKPPAGKQPGEDQGGTAANETQPGPAPKSLRLPTRARRPRWP